MMSDEELEYLDGSPFKEKVIKYKEFIKKQYDMCCKKISDFKGKGFGFKEYCEVYAILPSRNFGLELGNDVEMNCLIPFADMFNHGKPNVTNWFYDGSMKGFVLQALEDIPLGAEICICYDNEKRLKNDRLFQQYGFI